MHSFLNIQDIHICNSEKYRSVRILSLRHMLISYTEWLIQYMEAFADLEKPDRGKIGVYHQSTIYIHFIFIHEIAIYFQDMKAPSSLSFSHMQGEPQYSVPSSSKRSESRASSVFSEASDVNSILSEGKRSQRDSPPGRSVFKI